MLKQRLFKTVLRYFPDSTGSRFLLVFILACASFFFIFNTCWVLRA